MGMFVAMAFGAFLLILFQKYDQAQKMKIKKAEKKAEKQKPVESDQLAALTEQLVELTKAVKESVKKTDGS